MRLSVLSLSVMAAALSSQVQVSSAQSPNDYPWCFLNYENVRSCYYTSHQQRLEANSGIGTICVQNPGYRPRQIAPEAAPPDPTPVVSPRKRRQPQ